MGAARSGWDEVANRLRASIRDQVFAGPRLLADRYRVGRKLGAGGMGIVFEAVDTALQRVVAVKRLHGHIERYRLASEARALARVEHPNVVSIFDVGEDGDDVFIVMERIHGERLSTWLAGGPDAAAILDAFGQAAAGLHAAHQAGLVHRDFKPSNALIDATGRVRVIDFGLAQELGATHGDPPESISLDDDEPRRVSGTLAFMAPEVLAGRPSTAKADQYAWGVALRAALPGHERPDHVTRVLARAVRTTPQHRWPSLDVARRELLRRPAVSWRRRGLLGAATAAGLFVAFGPGADPDCAGIEDSVAASRSHAHPGPEAGAGRERVEGALDAYATSLAARWSEACEAGELSAARQRCFVGAAAELDAASRVLVAGPLSPRSFQAVAELEDPGACLSAQDGDTTPVHVRRAVARGRALLRSGERDEALAIADALIDDRTTQGRGRLAAELLRARALKQSDLTAAARGLEEVYFAATRARADDLAATAAIERLRVTGDPLDAQQWGRYGDVAITRGGLGPRARGGLALARYTVDIGYGRPREAAAAAFESLVWFALDGSLEDMGRATTCLGSATLDLGHPRLAEWLLTTSLQLRARAVGPDNPMLVEAYKSVGNLYREQGRHEEALAHFQHGLALAEHGFGPYSDSAARIGVNVGAAFESLDRHEEAEAAYRRALVGAQKVHGMTSPLAAIARHNLASLLRQKGALEAALLEFETAAEHLADGLGAEHPFVARPLLEAARIQVDLGDHDRALVSARRSIELLEHEEQPQGHLYLVALSVLAQALESLGRRDEALDAARRGLTYGEFAPDGSEVARLRAVLERNT